MVKSISNFIFFSFPKVGDFSARQFSGQHKSLVLSTAGMFSVDSKTLSHVTVQMEQKNKQTFHVVCCGQREQVVAEVGGGRGRPELIGLQMMVDTQTTFSKTSK